MDAPPVVGRRYSVLCGFNERRLYLAGAPDARRFLRHWWPLLGSAHADPELGVPGKHFHLDLRFMGEEQLRALGPLAAGQVVYADSFARLEKRSIRCRREQPAYPALGVQTLTPKLKRYHEPLDPECMRCPHRNFDLRQIAPDEQGIITCPLHGLQWWAATLQPVKEATP